MTKPCRGPNAPTAPSFALPRGACDTHLHVLGPYDRYPLSPDRNYTAPEAPLAKLRDYMAVTGLDRVVIAHVSAHGADMRVTLDAMAALGDRARGTAMLTSDATAADIARLDRAGMRGIRMSVQFGYPVDRDALRRVNDLAAPHNWHIAIWPSGPGELELLMALQGGGITVPVVLDHLANHCWSPASGLDQPGFRLLQEALRTGGIWLKLSGLYRASAEGWPWRGLAPFGRALVQEFSSRLLWASDWPHVGHWPGAMVNSGELLDWLIEIGCDAATRERILSRNPAALYGFPPLAAA